jgi:hypothetical protein
MGLGLFLAGNGGGGTVVAAESAGVETDVGSEQLCDVISGRGGGTGAGRDGTLVSMTDCGRPGL